MHFTNFNSAIEKLICAGEITFPLHLYIYTFSFITFNPLSLRMAFILAKAILSRFTIRLQPLLFSTKLNFCFKKIALHQIKTYFYFHKGFEIFCLNLLHFLFKFNSSFNSITEIYIDCYTFVKKMSFSFLVLRIFYFLLQIPFMLAKQFYSSKLCRN